MNRVAIVGAGVAGAGVAHTVDGEVSVFEQSAKVGGRTATHSAHGCTYDPGANYLKSDDRRVNELITETLETDGLIDIDTPVWTFDVAGTISEGEDMDEHKWNYVGGISQLAERLFERSGATVSTETRVETIRHNDEGWWLSDPAGADLGTFDRIVLTPPAPQTATLIGRVTSDDEAGYLESLGNAVAAVSYRPICSVVLHYPFELSVPYYALVNTDREHEIGWVSREECKSGHVPDRECLLIVQMAPDWSAERIDDDGNVIGTIESEVADLVADLFEDRRLATSDWSAVRCWPAALPNDVFEDQTVRARAERDGLFIAGDWIAGSGRIHRALNSGLAVGERLNAFRNEQ